jgi:7-carboxy-7-deazaguanine synthase
MFISEIFYSIQGEGDLVGVPSVFVRTSGCNLRCSWCDTKYASWNPEGKEMLIDEIVEEVSRHKCGHVVLTGGEPMIAKGIHSLAKALYRTGHHITIETAGTIPPYGIACDLASLSPKLSNSTPLKVGVWEVKHEERRLRPSVIDEWLFSYDTQLKFVVCSEQDIREIEELLGQLHEHLSPWKVMLMPEGVTTEQIHRHDAMIIDLCKSKGYRYCNRLHIELFGNTKGT